MKSDVVLPLEPMQDALDSGSAHLSTLVAETELAIRSLIKEAYNIASEHYTLFTNLSGQNGNDIGKMMPSVRHKEGKSGQTLEIRWVRSVKGPQGRIRQTVNKGKTHSYTITKLTRNCPEWECELIEKTEKQFAAVREIYSLLIKSRKNNKVINNVIDKHNKAFDG
jgi:hypothetical protein